MYESKFLANIINTRVRWKWHLYIHAKWKMFIMHRKVLFPNMETVTLLYCYSLTADQTMLTECLNDMVFKNIWALSLSPHFFLPAPPMQPTYHCPLSFYPTPSNLPSLHLRAELLVHWSFSFTQNIQLKIRSSSLESAFQSCPMGKNSSVSQLLMFF